MEERRKGQKEEGGNRESTVGEEGKGDKRKQKQKVDTPGCHNGTLTGRGERERDREGATQVS